MSLKVIVHNSFRPSVMMQLGKC